MQAEAWRLECSAWKVELDLNDVYVTGLKKAFESNFQSITFLEKSLSKDDLLEQGFNKQIVVQQGNASAKFDIIPALVLKLRVKVDMSLTAITAIIDRYEKVQQDTIAGIQSRLGEAGYSCKDPKPFAEAANAVVKSVITRIVSTVRKRIEAP